MVVACDLKVLWAARCSSRGRPKEAPYRDSKLTQLLWDGIRGTGRTLMIACITPFQKHMEETLNTLKYANTAIRIKSKPRIILDPRERQIEELQTEIKRLKRENLHLNRTINELRASSVQRPDLLSCALNDSVKLTPKQMTDGETFPELEMLEEEFQNNMMIKENSFPSSRSSLNRSKSSLSHDGEIQMDEIKSPSSQESHSAHKSMDEKTPSFSCQTKSHRKQRSLTSDTKGREVDFRTKIIEDLNRTRDEIHKQRQQLMNKLKAQITDCQDLHQWL